jgi:hypothetical protein
VRFAIAGAAALLAVAITVCLVVILPLHWALAIAAAVVWFTVPGFLIARALYGRQPGVWIAALLFGGVWGHGFSTLALLALWAAGYRRWWIVLVAPLLVVPIAALLRRLAGNLTLPAFTRRDVLAVLLLLLIVPAVVGKPFANVGRDLPDGRAYRAYFTADFVWRMAVAAEVSKGDVPPRNQYLLGEPLRYYWLPHLLPAVQHQLRWPPARLDKILLVHSIVLDLVFVAFLYGFARQLVSSPTLAAIGCVSAILFTSFEGLERLWFHWQQGLPIQTVRGDNIDAVERWYYGALPVDGLQRVLWYQPHHAMGYAIGLSALLCATQARVLGRIGLMVWLGTLLAVSLLISTFASLMLACMATLYVGARLLAERRYRVLVPCAMAAAAPLLVGLDIALRLQYVDRSESLMVLGLNPIAATNVPAAMILSFGPMLPAIFLGTWLAVQRRVPHIGVYISVVVVSVLFYFFVDVRDHQGVYVGWRSGHFIFIVSAGFAGYTLQELLRSTRGIRMATIAVALVLAAAAAPTAAIDIYNTQDIDNRARAPVGRWTTVLSKDEVDALDWVRLYTPKDAIVQVEPEAHNPVSWAYIPAFAERRMAAGLPIGMVPLAKYQEASRKIAELYRMQDPIAAHARAQELHVEYLVVGPPERDAFPHFQPMLDAKPLIFRPAFRNETVGIYRVMRE